MDVGMGQGGPLNVDYLLQPHHHYHQIQPHNLQYSGDRTCSMSQGTSDQSRAFGDCGGASWDDCDANSPIHSPRSQNTSREEDDSSNANEHDSKSSHQRSKSNQRWMKLRTTVQISSAISAKKPPLKREDSFLQRFSTRTEAQKAVEDTGSECGTSGNHGDSRRRRKRRRWEQPKSVVNPDSNFYFYWLLIVTLCVLYNLWTLIVRESFPELQEIISSFWLSCDLASDMVFVLDLVVQLRTGYLEQGLMVFNSKKLAYHYLKSRAFLMDLAALCPLDMLQLRFGWHPLLRCPRFLKVYRAVSYYYMVESRTVWPNLWRVVNLIHILLILAHWFGCFYFLLSEAENFQGDWVYPFRPGEYATLTRKYLGSVYWSTLTLTTIGDLPTPETNAEYAFTIVSYLIGVFIFATIVGQVGNVITNRNANRLEFERLLDGAKTYMRHHKVPGGMKRRVLRWYDYSWSRGRIQGGGDINTALGLLPDKLKTELALHVNLSVLKKVTIFQECQPEFLRDLVLKMKAYIFTPGDSICRKGEVAREMFIIADGILEVLSEHGKVLTTMKAGDFFGEIGILNLDGLNKRTADVRSVGYSELFSLSREDVLTAMKDYPEAQEILHALGRKRLMEVKASARHPPHKTHHHHMHHIQDGLGLVDRIRNEAKGLRNVLKKTKQSRRSQESPQLQPRHTTSTGQQEKATFREMLRIKSHGNSDDHVNTKDAGESTQPVTSPIGAGLPLLQRLKLLREKQEMEERVKSISPTTVCSATPVSNEAAPSNTTETATDLPLLQRILFLKEKNKVGASGPSRMEVGERTKSITGQLFSGVTLKKGSASIQESTSSAINATNLGKSFSRERIEGGTNEQRGKVDVKEHLSVLSSKVAIPSKLVNKVHLRDRLKVAIRVKGKGSCRKDSLPKMTELATTPAHSPASSGDKQLSRLTVEGSTDSSCMEPHWLKLKRAAVSKEVEVVTTSEGSSVETATTKVIHNAEGVGGSEGHMPDTEPHIANRKPNLTLTRKTTKYYRSIDDLSPEYAPLPFVKKLKILNERQKLEELETKIKIRNFSLDIPENQSSDSDTLTRSHSESSAIHQNNNLPTTPLSTSPLDSSYDPNETIERKNLRSILKKLSEHAEGDKKDTARVRPERLSSVELRKLMRAPTIEGYKARHSKLSKSVTFSRETLHSPPNGTNGDTQSCSPFVCPTTCTTPDPPPTNNVISEGRLIATPTEITQPLPDIKGNNKLNGSLEDEQQYFTDILFAIKQVMSSHLQDIQNKYHQKFEKLEEEMRHKDELISTLKAHIFEIERTNESSLTTGSLETVIGNEIYSWDDRPYEEGSHDLPNPLPSSLPQNTVVHIDSTTESESDVCEISDVEEQTDDCESSIEFDNSGSNWEIELLAAQMRQRRSASLDLERPLRQKLTKVSSVDLYK
ncbi:unnamed protein product [Acanthoscelides obtectus]|uniref:Cyclic nucleotide-binding domain-containing protein n=2 Tax=Acanthoscelides obtectus TaxID=200917 RepID=A0A9P0KJQ8_ACAOB|nr:unnamed protein product [Acanthoscelides obtectus]CAK1667473.1 Cyclic nucleotide-gated cation channel alpha-3 [Acanthoscelides obtectus]